MLIRVEYPELADRTDRFRHGAPHAVTVGGDGARVLFLRSSGLFDPADALWVAATCATGVERLVADPPGSSARRRASRSTTSTRPAAVAAFVSDGRLLPRRPGAGDVVEALATAARGRPPRPDPAGRHIGYVTGRRRLRVIEPDGTDELLAGEPSGVSWRDPSGRARSRPYRGYWWRPTDVRCSRARVVVAGRAGTCSTRSGRDRPRPPRRRRRSPCTCSTSTAAGSTCTGTGRPTRTWWTSHWAERRPADHRAAPHAAARPGARGRPAHRRDPGARRARRRALGRAGPRHPAAPAGRPGAGRRRAGARRVRRALPVRRRQPAHPAGALRTTGGRACCRVPARRPPAGPGRRGQRR